MLFPRLVPRPRELRRLLPPPPPPATTAASASRSVAGSKITLPAACRHARPSPASPATRAINHAYSARTKPGTNPGGAPSRAIVSSNARYAAA